MSPMKTPLQKVTDEHGGKEKLVDRIMGLIERGEQEQAELKQRLLAASNRKLLRLSSTLDAIRTRYGSKDKLAAAVAELMGKAKDADYLRKIEGLSPGRLLDMARSLSRRVGRAEPAPAAPEAAPAPKAKAATKAPKAKADKPEKAERSPRAAKTARAPKAESKAKAAPKTKK